MDKAATDRVLSAVADRFSFSGLKTIEVRDDESADLAVHWSYSDLPGLIDFPTMREEDSAEDVYHRELVEWFVEEQLPLIEDAMTIVTGTKWHVNVTYTPDSSVVCEWIDHLSEESIKYP